MSNSLSRLGEVRNRRGPYRRYFDADSIDSSAIPRTTRCRKVKEVNQKKLPTLVISDVIAGRSHALEPSQKSEVDASVSSENQDIDDVEEIEDTRDVDANEEIEGIDNIEDIEEIESIENTEGSKDTEGTDYTEDSDHTEDTETSEDVTDVENVEDTEDIEDVEEITYRMFERQIPRTSSRIDASIHIDHNLQSNYGTDEDNFADEGRNDAYLSEPLCSCTPTNRGETIMAVMTLGIRHSFTWVAIIDTLKTINMLFARDVVPATKYKLFKYFSTETEYFRYHIICPHCETLLGQQSKISGSEVKVCECGMEVRAAEMESFFLTASFGNQLKNLLTRPDVIQNLNYKHTRPENPAGDLRDIYDGEIYRKLSGEGEPLSHQYNLSYTFNTDGCQATDSSTTSLWPIYATINELPPDMRNKNMILVGIWACQRKPNMASFLRPFVDDAMELSTNGITFEINGRGIVTSKLFAICACVDSVARSAMLNMKQFNGYYGCTLCEHPGELVKDKAGRKSVKFTVSTQVPPDRTHESIIRDMQAAYDITRATRKRMDVKGVFGPSPLMNLACFNLASGLPPDSMHLLYGLIKQYTNILLDDTGTDFYIGAPNVVDLINERLTTITPPQCITRTPRSLKDRALWKASEWRSWLIFYSLVCLDGILPRKYLSHFALLVTAIHILMGESIPRDKLRYAHESILKFVVLFQLYFKKSAMNYNVHLLLHVCRGVENFGPLWTHTAYPYENENRHVLQLKKSPTHLSLQICRRFVMYKTINCFGDRYAVSHRVKIFCEQLSEKRVQFSFKTDDCTLIGSGKWYSLNDEEKTCLQGCEINSCLSYDKIICQKFRYTSTRYTRSRKTSDSAVMTNNGTFVVITNICKISGVTETPKVVVFCREIEIIDSPFLETTDVCVTHIKKCRDINAGRLRLYSPESLQAPCVVMKTNRGHFVSCIPKGCLGD